MKAGKGRAGYPEASLSTPYGKVLAFVIDRTRVYVMTGWRKPRLRVGVITSRWISISFALPIAAGASMLTLPFSTVAAVRSGGIREKIVRAVASEVETWIASLPQSAIVAAEAWDSGTTSGRRSEARYPI